MSKNKNAAVGFIIMFSFPVMLLFQNCGQQGSLEVSGGSQFISSSLTAGDDIPKDIPSDVPTDDPNNPSTGGGGMVIVPPTAPPVASPVTPPTVPPVVVQPPTEVPDDKDDHDDNVQTHDCRNIEISDIRLGIESVGANSSCLNRNKASSAKDQPDFEILSSDATITLSSPVLKLRALKNMEVKQLFVRLSDSGNQVLSMDNVAMDLVTPSSQQSGLKFQLQRSIKIQAGQKYDLKFEIRAEDQFVMNASKCILKPVIKSAQLVLSN